MRGGPWSSREAGVVGLTFLLLTLDAVTTIILFRSGAWGIGFEEINIVVGRMHENVVVGALSYNLQWVVLILLFRPMREVEYSLSMLHSLSSGMAAVDNVAIILSGETASHRVSQPARRREGARAVRCAFIVPRLYLPFKGWRTMFHQRVS